MPEARVHRRDDGIGLRALRVGGSPAQLVVHVGTDVIVRTPARPDFHDGNVYDLLTPPDASDVGALVERVRRALEPVGVAHLHLRFELPVGAAPDADLVAALEGVGFTLDRLLVMELTGPVALAGQPIGLERLTGPLDDAPGSGELVAPAVVRDRRWYAASVLDRYALGDDVETWRRWDDGGATWYRAQLRELAALGRAEVWLATRIGMPVATATVVRDLDGLAVVQDVVTHPAHRRRGIARALVSAAVAFEQRTRPDDRILLAVTEGGPAELLYRSLGFRPLLGVIDAQRPRVSGSGPDGSRR